MLKSHYQEKKESLEKCLLPWEGYYNFTTEVAFRSIFPVDALTWTNRHSKTREDAIFSYRAQAIR